MITTNSSVATTTSEPVVPPLSSSFTSAAAHTTSEGGFQSASPTTLSQTIQGTKVLSNTTPSSAEKIRVTTKAEISPSAHSPGRNTPKSVNQQQPNSSIGGTTSHISPPRQSDSLTKSASLGVRSQPGPSSVSPTLTVSSSLHQERANSTVVTRTTRSFAPTTQALIPSPSPSSNCTEFTVFEKDCSESCSNVGGQVEATEWCPSHSTVPANPKSKGTKTVKCEEYCPLYRNTEAFRSLLSTVIVGILLFT
ncbi:unnamed protein product [Porites evermanni]|uniref:Uncharacterized protein n=1 Tax=Porites evermanni TaxID=104178 RepID=A0ABN8LDG9_9CNID|nr:unnamed protein product [Porites evermanni]